MKFNITVDLDWLEEEGGNLDEIVKSQVIDAVVSRVSASAIGEATRAAQEAASGRILAAIDEQVAQITKSLLDRRFDLTDKYGHVKVADTCVMDELKKQLDGFLTERVDSNGKKAEYSRDEDTRLNWLLKSQIDSNVKAQVRIVGETVQRELKAYIDTTLKAQIGENVAKAIGLDGIIKKI
jgi:hypothetical protein